VADRTPCAVPFCRKTTKGGGPGYEWICADHWRHADRGLRRRYAAAQRAQRPAANRLWRAIKVQVVERAFGIG